MHSYPSRELISSQKIIIVEFILKTFVTKVTKVTLNIYKVRKYQRNEQNFEKVYKNSTSDARKTRINRKSFGQIEGMVSEKNSDKSNSDKSSIG